MVIAVLVLGLIGLVLGLRAESQRRQIAALLTESVQRHEDLIAIMRERAQLLPMSDVLKTADGRALLRARILERAQKQAGA